MNDALEQLRDLHLPVPPGMWPPAPGWWILAALLVAGAFVLAVRLHRIRRRGRPFRLAAGTLDRLLADCHARHLSAREFADAVNELLKRVLIHGARRFDAAPLTGRAWLLYLDGIVASDVFSSGAGTSLGHQRFAPDFQSDPDALHAAARDVLAAVRKSAAR